MYVVYWKGFYWIYRPYNPATQPNWEHDEQVTYWLFPNPTGDWNVY